MGVRHIDDQPADLALPHLHQLGGDDLEMPIHRQAGLLVQIGKAAPREGGKVLPQQNLIFSSG